jgi:hypothetical protein
MQTLVPVATLLAKVFPRSLYRGSRDRRMFEQIEACLFIGYPRSGHSLIGSLIDAHPHAALGHELDLLKYVYCARAPASFTLRLT